MNPAEPPAGQSRPEPPSRPDWPVVLILLAIVTVAALALNKVMLP